MDEREKKFTDDLLQGYFEMVKDLPLREVRMMCELAKEQAAICEAEMEKRKQNG